MIRHIPNAVTVTGLLLTCLAIHLAATPWIAISALVAGQACDVLDGWLARRLDACSDFGARLDATCDIVVVHLLGMTMESWWILAVPVLLPVQVALVSKPPRVSGRLISVLTYIWVLGGL